jgi:transposase, IS5 family
MRQKRGPQQNLLYFMARNEVARELEAISQVLDLVFRDLVKYPRTDTGRDGMTAEQVLRGASDEQVRAHSR